MHTERTCEHCKHATVSIFEWPCRDCGANGRIHWQPKEGKREKTRIASPVGRQLENSDAYVVKQC